MQSVIRCICSFAVARANFNTRREMVGFVSGICQKSGAPIELFASPGLGAKEYFEARQTRQKVLNRVGDSSV